jgi:hypothetical protein
MVKGSTNEYWGLQKKITQPPVAWNQDKNCDRMSGENSPPCIYKTPGATKTVLLIGDSLAASFSQALIDASKKSNWNSVIWTMASCKFALSDKTGVISNACLKRNGLILSWINEYRPSLVIVSQYNKIQLPQAELKSGLLAIKSLTPNVLVIGNTPMFPDQRYMSYPAIFQNQYKAPKKVLISKMDKRDESISKTFLNEIEVEGIEVANLNYLWCTQEYCNRFGSKGWLFFDVYHLSLFGADMSVPYFTKFLSGH